MLNFIKAHGVAENPFITWVAMNLQSNNYVIIIFWLSSRGTVGWGPSAVSCEGFLVGELWSVPWLGERVTYLLTYNNIVDSAYPEYCNSTFCASQSYITCSSKFIYFPLPSYLTPICKWSKDTPAHRVSASQFAFHTLFLWRFIYPSHCIRSQWGLGHGLGSIRQTFIYRNLPTLMSN